MPKYIDLNKQLVRLYRLNLTYKDVIKEFLLSAETIDVPERKVGEWLPIIDANENGEPYQAGVYCSECGYSSCCEDNYCPNCGAEMKGEE